MKIDKKLFIIANMKITYLYIYISIISLLILLLFCVNPVDFDDHFYISDVDADELKPVNEGLGLISISIDPNDLTYLLGYSKKHGNQWKRECKVYSVFGPDTFNNECHLKIHGGISRTYYKKSFKLYFKEKNIKSDYVFNDFPNNEKLSNSFSMLILNGNCIDFSNIRNYLSMYISSLLGARTPRVGFVRLIINDKYYGLYSVIERINRDMGNKILNHTNFSLLKSYTNNGNLKTYNDFTNTKQHDPTEGFELKDGNWEPLKNFVTWLESDDYSYNDLTRKVTDQTLFGFNMGYYYCGVTDSYSKNFYFLYDKEKKLIDLIHWDSDASFGRAWDGRPRNKKKLLCNPQNNGISQKALKSPKWVSEMEDRFTDAFNSPLKAKNVLKKIEYLEKLLNYEAINDLDLWYDIVIQDFNTDYWNLRSFTSDKIWENELALIRDFVKTRQKVVMDQFNKDFLP